MDNTYTIKKNFTALDFEEGNLVYDATHDAMLKVAYIGKRKVQSKTILQIIFEDTANGMLIRVEALDEKGTLPKDNRGRKQFKHLIKIRVSNPTSIPYWIYPQRTYPVYPPYDNWATWSTNQTCSTLSLDSRDRLMSGAISSTRTGTINSLGNITPTGTINKPSNITIASDNVSSTSGGNTSTWTTSSSTGSLDISNSTTINNDQIQQDQKASQAFWNMFGFGYDEEKEEYIGKF